MPSLTPPRRHPTPMILTAVALATAIGAASILSGERRIKDGSVLKPGGAFYRFDASWIVKDGSEPLSVSVVVPCQRTLVSYRSGEVDVSTEDPAMAPSSKVAAVTSKDGGVLVAEVPELCGPGAMLRATARKIVPKAVWYAQGRRLADPGAAEDQGDYALPSAKVEFLNASVSNARFADYATFVAARKGFVAPAGTPFGFSESQVSGGIPALPRHETVSLLRN